MDDQDFERQKREVMEGFLAKHGRKLVKSSFGSEVPVAEGEDPDAIAAFKVAKRMDGTTEELAEKAARLTNPEKPKTA